ETSLVAVLDLIETRPLRGELSRHRRRELIEPLLLDVHANLLLARQQLRALIFDGRHDAVLEELLVGLGFEPRAFVLSLRDGEPRALIELLALQAQLRLRELGPRGLELVSRLLGLPHQIRVRELDEHGIRLDGRAGPYDDTLDPAVGLRGNPANL